MVNKDRRKSGMKVMMQEQTQQGGETSNIGDPHNKKTQEECGDEGSSMIFFPKVWTICYGLLLQQRIE